MSRVVVAGGTGLVGRLVVERLRSLGATPVVVARSTGADLTTGAGVEAAVDGAEVVVDVSNVVTTRRSVATGFFSTATDHLLRAGERAGVRHHVVLSIVGVDRVDFGYYLGKRAQEDRVTAGPVPWTVLRATQFHEFTEQMLAGRGPLALVPRMRSQPVAAAEVADRVVELALAAPAGHAEELAGPEVHEMPDLVRRLAARRGLRRPVLGVRLPGATGAAMTGGGLLPTGPGRRGTQTFDAWLDQAHPRPAHDVRRRGRGD